MKNFFWSFLEVLETVVIAVVAVVLIRSFIAQPFLVSGSSMEPSFHHGDYLLVDELTYNFRSPQRGEIVVFRDPTTNSSYFIKRVIGLPGEHILIDENGVAIGTDGEDLILIEEYILDTRTLRRYEVELGSDEYFVMGDNRAFSFDSRNWGPLHEDAITGLVRLRLWPLNAVKAVGVPTY